jgi:hypothetical protein
MRRLRIRGGVAIGLAVGGVAACDPRVITEPGPVRDLEVKLALLDLPDAERNAIGSFNIEVVRDNAVVERTAVSRNPDTGVVSFLDEPPRIPAGGIVEVRVVAVNVSGEELPIGGRTTPIDLDRIDGGAPVEARVLVGRLEGFTAAAQLLATPRLQHTATSTGAGTFLVVGGRRAGDETAGDLADEIEWFSPFSGEHCTSGGVGNCAFGAVPPARIEHVAVDLSARFDAACPVRGVLVLGGVDETGAPLADVWRFDADGLRAGGAFSTLPSLVKARAGAGAVALPDCRVVVVGGEDAAGPVTDIEIVDLGGPVPVVTTVGTLPFSTRTPIVIETGNALQEFIIAGGLDERGDRTSGAVSVSLRGDDAALCALDTPCNNQNSALRCPRAAAATAPLQPGSELTPALIVGGTDDRCDASVEVFRASFTGSVNGFVAVGASPAVTRTAGATVTPLRGGGALLMGGRDGQGLLRAEAERFAPIVPIEDVAGPLAGAFTEVGDAPTPRAFHAAVLVEGAVVAVGGLGEVGPEGSVDVFIGDWR